MGLQHLPRQLTPAQRVVGRCRELAQVSEERGRLTRPYASAAMVRANALVGGWMAGAGLDVALDAAGNLVGRRAGTDPDGGTLLLGSHLDTVRDAGAFDGPLGVLCAIEAVAAADPTPFAVEVLGFADEEGLRYGTAYLGSRALAGTFDPGLLDLADDDGVRLADALRGLGGDPDRVTAIGRRPEDLLGYVEVHMEQGPVLELAGLPVGVVSAIAGATRAEVTFTGTPAHAGTTPMTARQDALLAAAAWALAVERAPQTAPGLLATVGRFAVPSGATNVVPGRVVASLDVRHADDGARIAAVERLRREAVALGALRGVEVAWRTTLETPAVAVDETLTGHLAASVHARGIEVLQLPSGAGHDAVALAGVTGVAMLFVRCAGGRSHHPAESVAAADAAVAVDVITDLLARL